ncbi:MAG: hypothetical protein HY646_01910, partial [Acidobacteria bacterium]|nr:hypothetical protein [Acidobacteriota bacterium]
MNSSKFKTLFMSLILVVTFATQRSYAQDSTREIQQLRERIRLLEHMVQQLNSAQTIHPSVQYEPAVLRMAAESTETLPAAPADPTPVPRIRSTYVRELLPDIGKIGAEIGIIGGGGFNPFQLDKGLFAGGYIDLPLRRVPGGKLSYEILAGLSESHSEFETSSQVAVVANLAAGASLANALAGTPNAPFPVKQMTRTRLRLLEVSPALFKYTITSMDHYRFRPY